MRKTAGFTLLEMSIVILIIALFIAGIMGGKTLIRQSELRSVLQEYDQYKNATKEFLDKYGQLPGDYTAAATAWGDDGCPTNAFSASAAGSTATCSGDGDGLIANCNGDLGATTGSCSDVNEAWRVWQHLSNAGLIEGRFTGRTGDSDSSTATQATPGLNVPASKLKPAGWTFLYYLNTSNQTWLPRDHYGHVFLFGGGRGGYSGIFTTEPTINTYDALGMDLKIDDGLPTTGMLRAWDDYWAATDDNGPTVGAGTSHCVNGTEYYYDNTGYNQREFNCSLIFMPGL